jgi:dihydroflavonol-4-reductase
VTGYSESKFFSETEIWRGIEEGLDAVIVNPSIILGPANWETGSARLFKTIWDGMPFYTRGVTGYVDVMDVVRPMIQLMDPEIFETAKNQRYILSAGNISFRELFSQIADVLEKPKPKYFSSNFMLDIAWRAAAFWGWIILKPAMLTRETVANSNEINRYDGSKISRLLNFQYIPVSASIKQTAALLKNDMLSTD